jgi:hypothetical protein
MPLAHLLWRLSEGRTAALQIRVSSACEWPSCHCKGREMSALTSSRGNSFSRVSLRDGTLKDLFILGR